MTTEHAAAEFEYDESVVGVEVELGSFEITTEQVERFRRALGSTGAVADGDVAPPGILGSISFGRQGNLDAKVQFGNTTFMAGQRLEFHEPLRTGATYHAKTKIKEVYGKTGRSGTMVFVVRRTEYTDDSGTLVAAAEASQVHREVQSREQGR